MAPTKELPEAIGALAEMLTMARHIKSMFDSFVEAGFTEDQAIKMVGATLGGQK